MTGGQTERAAIAQRFFTRRLMQEDARVEHRVARASREQCLGAELELAAAREIRAVHVLLDRGHGFSCSMMLIQALHGKTPPKLEKWRLCDWIDVLTQIRLLSPNVKHFGHALREFRNHVHPEKELDWGFCSDEHTARISFHVVAAALTDLARASQASQLSAARGAA